MAYQEGDAFLFGPESVGLPAEVQNLPWITERLKLPMVPGVRSINLSNSAAIVVYEAWRQLGFEGSQQSPSGDDAPLPFSSQTLSS